MNKPEKWRIIINIILATFSFLVCIMLGYVLSALLFQLTGKPTGFVSYLISAVMGILLFAGVARLSAEIFSHTKYGKEHYQNRHQFLNSTLRGTEQNLTR